eukprot:TRINITY_DN28601_c0_g1_i1.p1 TRINITY_DN28601_c0_g1~~TRINITY_DN28601_c0_g1_i1.p1  ORF type:complete len:624 (-),score=99.32 TRINITY_DN28601_c0_g1_i1:125-1996(-)
MSFSLGGPFVALDFSAAPMTFATSLGALPRVRVSATVARTSQRAAPKVSSFSGQSVATVTAAAAAISFASASRRRMGRGSVLMSRLNSRLPERRSMIVAQRAVSSAAPPPHEILFRPDVGPKVQLVTAEPDAWRGGSLVLFLAGNANGPLELGSIGDSVDRALGGVLRAFVDEEDFDAKPGSVKTLQVFNENVKRVILVGVGAGDKGEIDWRLAGASAATAVKTLKQSSSVGIASVDGVNIQSLVEGFYMGLHVDNRFKGSKTPSKEKTQIFPSAIELLGTAPASAHELAVQARSVASGVIFARELVNGAPNIVTPPSLAAVAADLASQVGLKATILDEAECEAMGMGSFLAVGRCSDLPSKLIHLVYTPPDGNAKRKIGIVGKGLTFDSGGYNLKAGPGSMIEMMKFDMGGSAATLGAAAAIAQLRPKDVEVHFVIAACENMISGNPGSLRPGDIITAMDGTTIEVNNTDAEGRLTLADALLYCQRQGATEIVDVATLTGACMVALGSDIAGMWSNSDELAAGLNAAANATGEKIWRMPLEEAYMEGLKSDFADMKNTGPRFGGAITAALFLSKFVDKNVRWAHLDIAGTVWAEKPKGVNVTGGTGSMVRTLTELVCTRSRA